MGKQDSNINILRSETGCKIDMIKNEDTESGSMVKIRLVGTKSACDDAQGRIKSFVGDMTSDVKVLLPVHLTRKFIGKEASGLKALQQETNCLISFDQSKIVTHDGVDMYNVSISGKRKEECKKSIQDFINGLPIHREILVPANISGEIIGKEGNRILQLESKTGCTIEMIENVETESGSMAKFLFMGDEAACNEAQNRLQSFFNSLTNATDIFIPANLTGSVIGKEGSHILQLQSETGCKIEKMGNVETESGPMYRFLAIGDESACNDARNRIQSLVEKMLV